MRRIIMLYYLMVESVASIYKKSPMNAISVYLVRAVLLVPSCFRVVSFVSAFVVLVFVPYVVPLARAVICRFVCRVVICRVVRCIVIC